MKRLRNQLFADSKVERGNLALAMHGW
jgi:hypothetical protein